ncbi:hypothetical protein pdam_00016631 [Pocillopora damicornis]|uniref:SEA domain-containing protein n=1 Tax=Pocillopora damicornis TaxID=46731 RepID=A0A3M6TFQ3_POCDA|nr:hypothetical protein pdam_00016631 [Pocillopora damicornis]
MKIISTYGNLRSNVDGIPICETIPGLNLYICFIWIVVLIHKQVSAGYCWSGKDAETSFPLAGQAFDCKTFDSKSCGKDDKYCVGEEKSVFVYRLLDNQNHTLTPPKPSCPSPKSEHHYDLECKVYNLTVLMTNTSFDDFLWFAHSPQFIELRREFELGVLQAYDGYDPFLGVTTLRFSEAPGDSNIVVHFAIEFKDKGVHLHNLTAALACQTLGKLTFLPSLGQVACYKAPPPPVCPLPCFSACAPHCYSSCCQQYHPYYYAPTPSPPHDINPAPCPEGCPITCAPFGCTTHCCSNGHSLPHYVYGKRHEAPKPEKQSKIGHIFRKHHGKN